VSPFPKNSPGLHRNSFLETVRIVTRAELQEQRRVLLLVLVLMVGALIFVGNTQLHTVQTPAEAANAADTMAGLMVTSTATLLSLVALFLPATCVLRDQSRRTAPLIWSRPISAPAYLLGRFLGALTPALLGTVAALATGLWFVGAANHGGPSSLTAEITSYLALFGAQVPVAFLYPAALTFCLASFSGSEELAYIVGVAYWLTARVPLGNAWMVNFASVTIGGLPPSALSLGLLGAPVLLNRLFYGILAGGLLLATLVFYNRTNEPRSWLIALAHPAGGWASWIMLGICGAILVLIVVLAQQVHVGLPPAWKLFF
jgi:ABC-type transport system involved in multi-copper enzyme maturation permease subunit